jgi:hypothetical protein
MLTTELDTFSHAKPVLDTETERLAQFLSDHFPEEVASADLSDEKSVFALTLELLKRLSRWEK